MNEILFLVYNNDDPKSIKAKQIIKLGDKEHHMSFELIWGQLRTRYMVKDDYYLSKITGTATIDDLILITDTQLN